MDETSTVSVVFMSPRAGDLPLINYGWSPMSRKAKLLNTS